MSEQSNNLIINFINNVSQKRMDTKNTVKKLTQELRNYQYTPAFHHELLKGDAYIYDIKGGKHYKKRNLEKLTYSDSLICKMFIPYGVEKFIFCSSLDNKSKKIPNLNTMAYIHDCHNKAGNIKPKSKDSNFITKLFTFIGYEQIRFQEVVNEEREFLRLIELYEDYPEVDKFLINTYGFTLEKVCFYIYSLFSYILKFDVNCYFKIEDFIRFTAINELIEVEEIKKFLDFFLININEFNDEYTTVRSDLENPTQSLSYNRLQEIDKFLPKISYRYPLLITENSEHMLLLSYTSLFQAMRLERIYDEIYLNKNIDEFKSKIHGPAINNYIKKFAFKYLETKCIYGDEEYFISKKQPSCDAPDVIIEFPDYVIIIEAKSKAFDLLKVLKSYDTYDFSRFGKDITTSEKNIKRYFDNQNDFKGKKVFTFLCYFTMNSMMLSSCSQAHYEQMKIDKQTTIDDLIITDIRAIEYLLQIKSNTLDIVIESFFDKKINIDNSTFSTFIQFNYAHEIEKNIKSFESIFKKYLPSE